MKTRIWIVCLILASFYLGSLYLPARKLRIKNRKKLTHISKVEPYLSFCRRASIEPAVFDTFKRDPVYTLFYENVTYEEGLFFYESLKEDFPEFLGDRILEKMRQLDGVGSPIVFEYGEVGSISPTTLRYLYLAAQLQMRFGSLDGMRVIEIGGGSGGLCKVLTDLFAIDEYTLVDMTETLRIAKAHLESFAINGVRYVSIEDLEMGSCDLLISQYAFTESNRPLQKRYMEFLFRGAKRGYLICNFVMKHFRARPFAKEDLLKHIRILGLNEQILPEIPQTGELNFILTWQEKNDI